jgi:hypothetical protein
VDLSAKEESASDLFASVGAVVDEGSRGLEVVLDARDKRLGP